MNKILTNDLGELEREFKKNKIELHASAKFYDKYLVNQLPENWKYCYCKGNSIYEFGRLLLISHADTKEDKPLITFKKLVDYLENLGYEFDKSFEEYYGFNAYQKDNVEMFDGKFKLHVRQLQYDKCEIEYVEELTKRPVVKGFCAEVLK